MKFSLKYPFVRVTAFHLRSSLIGLVKSLITTTVLQLYTEVGLSVSCGRETLVTVPNTYVGWVLGFVAGGVVFPEVTFSLKVSLFDTLFPFRLLLIVVTVAMINRFNS